MNEVVLVSGLPVYGEFAIFTVSRKGSIWSVSWSAVNCMHSSTAFNILSLFSVFTFLGITTSTSLKEPRSDLRHHSTTNSLVLHAEEQGHLPRWENATVLHTRMEKMKKLTKAAYIATSLVTDHREGFVSLSRSAAKFTLMDKSARSPGRCPHRWYTSNVYEQLFSP